MTILTRSKKKEKDNKLNAMAKLTYEAERDGEVKSLHEQGYKVPYISEKTGFSIRQVRCRLEKLKKFGSMLPRPRSGRPKVTNERDVRRIQLVAERYPFKSINQLRAELPDLNISRSTFARLLTQNNKLVNRVALQKPPLSRKNIRLRYEWAKEHENWSVNEWNKILWSDETIFTISSFSKRRVWRPPDAELDPKYVQPLIPHPANVIVWGCFCGHGVGKIVKINETLTSRLYVSILRQNLRSSAEMYYDDEDWIFQQDNDPKHKASLTTDYLNDSGVNIIQWPAYSPDLNPIEHIWAFMKHELETIRISNANELWDKVQNIWNNLSDEYLQNLVNSMPERVAAVIKAKGGVTRF